MVGKVRTSTSSKRFAEDFFTLYGKQAEEEREEQRQGLKMMQKRLADLEKVTEERHRVQEHKLADVKARVSGLE